MIDHKPNLFKIATKELAQDSFITWLLQWSSPTVRDKNYELHKCGMALLSLLLGDVDGFNMASILEVRAGRQWENIDIWAEVECGDGCKILLIVEDKTFTKEHSNQLIRYKETAQKWCLEEGYQLTCAFLKIGSEPVNVLEAIKEKGFRVFDRLTLLRCLGHFRYINESLINDFLDYLQELEDNHQSFQRYPLKDWNGFSWIGFYQYIEGVIDIVTWHYVDNPSGGFWNLLLNWEQWHDFPVYIQIEQGKLCYKVALDKDETGLPDGTIDSNEVQLFLSNAILKFGKETGYNGVIRPSHMARRGAYRTFAIVEKETWLGNNTGLIDKERAVQSIQFQLHHYYQFKTMIDRISYEQAGISIKGGIPPD
jgi:hypothetical protein